MHCPHVKAPRPPPPPPQESTTHHNALSQRAPEPLAGLECCGVLGSQRLLSLVARARKLRRLFVNAAPQQDAVQGSKRDGDVEAFLWGQADTAVACAAATLFLGRAQASETKDAKGNHKACFAAT